MKDGAPADLSGYTAAAIFYRSDGALVKTGSISGNVVTVYFPQEAYTPAGQYLVVLWLTDSVVGVRIPVDAATLRVVAADESVVIDPGDYIPSIADVVGALETMATATTAANDAATAANEAAAAITVYGEQIAEILALFDDLNGDDTAY